MGRVAHICARPKNIKNTVRKYVRNTLHLPVTAREHKPFEPRMLRIRGVVRVVGNCADLMTRQNDFGGINGGFGGINGGST